MDRYINKDLEDITIMDLRMYISHKQNKVLPNTLNSIIVCVKSFFGFLFLEDIIDIHIILNARSPNPESQRSKVYQNFS